MINLKPDVCRKIRNARREAGISQSVLSAEIGCKQSALSMFEQGDGTKINDEAVKALCRKFGIEINAEEESKRNFVPFEATAVRGFCPNPSCPSHEKYMVEDSVFLKPDRVKQDPVFGKFCAVCGEVLEKKCPECGREIHEGAVCSFCGRKYVGA